MVLVFFICLVLCPRGLHKVMIVITPDHMVACPLRLATLFHQSKLVDACLYLPLWVGVQIKLVMPVFMIT